MVLPLSDASALALITTLDRAADTGTHLPREILAEAARQLTTYAFRADPAVARTAYQRGRQAFGLARDLRGPAMEGPWRSFLTELGLPADGYPFEPARP